ncbi:hypothetical protein RB595_009124 [Gaeumannomyces hyphopodioides]
MSDEVSSFLRDVEQLKGRRTEEDEARSRELEEKILQERRERQARREERARSISPQKSSPAHTPPPTLHRKQASQILDGLNLESSPRFGTPEHQQPRVFESDDGTTPAAMASEDYSSTSPTKENDSPFDADPKTSNGGPQARAMSWQRRPGSQAAERPKSRPLSVMAAENAATRSSVGGGSDETDSAATPSRDQIAHALSSKDPAWFRQTADRGQNSAAYRRSQVEDDTPRMDMSSASAELPGMSRHQQPVSLPSPTEPTEAHKSFADHRSQSASLYGKVGSPMSLTPAQRLDPPASADAAGDGETSPLERVPQMSPSLGRTSPTRPISPTKGMGGFVQSAMMKRTDSVKRWSVHSPTGLQRADTVASNRNSVDITRMGAGRSHSRSGSAYRGESISRPTSGPNSRPASRPTSSHGLQDETADAGPVESAASHTEETKAEEDKTEPPVSPSKTMDPRRWSPTKSSSWLEAALNKPESPKPKQSSAPSNHNQPTWMAELNKVKSQKGGDPGSEGSRAPSATHRHEVKVGGLLRSTPMGSGVKPTPLPGKIPVHTPSLPTNRLSVSDLRGNLAKPSPTLDDGQRSFGDAPEKKTLASTINTSKPETPPKKDFRASLKPFQPPPTSTSGGNADELKNVFGTLRKTKTQNYVAPDELKDNITRGLAGLNATGGPKPSVRKDEFKDAILQRKAEFQKAKTEGRGVTRNFSDAADKPLPEGLAKKLELGRSGSIGVRKGSIIQEMAAAAEARPAESPRPADYARSASMSTPFKPTSPQSGGSSAAVPKPLGGRLADRFNPGLAGLLARGPPGAGAGGPGSASESSGSQGASGSGGSAEPSAPGPQLTHMTKGRARGPPRKAPSSVAKPAGETTSSMASQPKSTAVSPTEEQPAQVAPATAAKSPSPVVQQERFSRPKSSYGTSFNEPTPTANDASVDPPRPKSRSATSPTKNFHDQVAALARGRQGLPEPAPAKQEETAAPVSPHKSLHVRRMSKFFDETAAKPEPEQVRPLSPSKTGTVRRLPEFEAPKPLSPQKTGGRQLPEGPRSPPKQTRDEQPQPVSGSNTPTLKSRMSGFFAAAAASSATPTIDSRRNTLHSRSRSLAREQIQPLPIPDTDGPRSPPAHSPVRSPTKEIASTLNEFFGRSRPTRDYRVDAAEILTHRPEGNGAAKIKTLSAQLFRVGPDGKKQPVPAHQDRVLFEAEMYLCVHSFADADSGRQGTEVYFWAGDEVSPSAVEDAQLFAGREARSAGGRLVRMSQGKETAEFLQALGGIVTVRRGSGAKYDQLAPSMLCGRRHLGQVTFDEVDLSPHSLCSGFVYLVTKNGQCHMWKGKGSDVEELGCARLVGMELALMGELVEVDDGAETDEFWSLFGAAADGSARAVSADHWRLKPNYPKYSARLFRSDAEDRQQIAEIWPFNQADLDPAGIYILDAFFEMYIVVGYGAQPQYASFRNALDFAQEYAILASSMEDRPFVPISTVVLEGIPRDLKSVFRKWRDAASPTRMNAGAAAGGGAAISRGASPVGGLTANGGGSTSPGLKRARSLRIVPLNQALLALAE